MGNDRERYRPDVFRGRRTPSRRFRTVEESCSEQGPRFNCMNAMPKISHHAPQISARGEQFLEGATSEELPMALPSAEFYTGPGESPSDRVRPTILPRG